MTELKENPIVQQFLKVFAYTGYLDWFKDEKLGNINEAILISDPSNICGIVYTDKILKLCIDDTGWRSYIYNGFKPSKKNTNYVLFEGQFYSVEFMLKAFNKFFKDKTNFEIRISSVAENDYYALLIKIDGTFSIGIANLKDIAIREEKGGVAFLDTDWVSEGDTEKQVEVGRHYVEWDKGKAVYTSTWMGRDWTKVVYSQDYLFNKQEEIGDSLLI